MSQHISSRTFQRRRGRRPAVLVLFVLLVTVGACSSATPGRRPAPPPAEETAAARQLQSPETHAEEPAVTGGGASSHNVIRWTTASELDNFGYDVYRSESESGPFERINPEVIPGAGSTDEPSHYSFVDDTNDPRKAYYYYVESISMSGVRERFTPVGKVPPKIQGGEGEKTDER